jgi:hypothetical protein
MTSLRGRRRNRHLFAAATALGAVGLVGLSGCGGEEPPPVVKTVAPAPRPVAPPPPKLTPISELMALHRIDERVVLPEEQAPDNNEDRIAVLQFFDAFARGDDRSLGKMMSLADKFELDALVESDQWTETVREITRIEIQTGANDFGDECALAVFEVGYDFQPQLWYYKGGDDYTFEAVSSPPGILDKLSGRNWIKAWHDVLDEEMELANKPDNEYDIPQVNLDEDEGSTGASAPSGRGPGVSPGGGGNPFGRRPPPRTKRKPPAPR